MSVCHQNDSYNCCVENCYKLNTNEKQTKNSLKILSLSDIR